MESVARYTPGFGLISIFTLLIAIFSPGVALAHVPVLVEQESIKDVYMIEDPTLSQAFYGEMHDFPHTYEIQAAQSFTLFTQILEPDIDTSKNNVSGIIIKLPEKRGRVTEITRMSLPTSWQSEYEPFGGDTYLMGPIFEQELGPGTYRIEVHTPDNREKYVLVVGTREELTIGYFELLGRLMEVKEFFGKSKFRIIESPYVYVPLVACLIIGYLLYRRFYKRNINIS